MELAQKKGQGLLPAPWQSVILVRFRFILWRMFRREPRIRFRHPAVVRVLGLPPLPSFWRGFPGILRSGFRFQAFSSTLEHIMHGCFHQ